MISASFLGRQEAAIAAQSAVCHALVMAGIDVTHMGLKLAKTRKQFNDYRQGHDMIAHVNETSVPVEVKSSSRSWTGAKDYPSYRPLVCSQATADKKGMVHNGVLGVAHVLISQPEAERLLGDKKPITGAMLVILPGTEVIERVPWKDRTRGEDYLVIQCRRKDLRPFSDLVAHIRYLGGYEGEGKGPDAA